MYPSALILAALALAGCTDQGKEAPGTGPVPQPAAESASQSEVVAEVKPAAEEKIVPHWIVNETELFVIPQDHRIMPIGQVGYLGVDIYFSKDGTQFGYKHFVSGVKNNSAYIVDGNQSASEPWKIKALQVDENYSNGHQVIPTKVGEKYSLIANGKTYAVAESKHMEGATVSDDGKQYGYASTDGHGDWYAIVNGIKSVRYDIIGPQSSVYNEVQKKESPWFAFENGKSAFIMKKDGQFGVVVNGVESSGLYAFVHYPMFSQKYDHFMFRAGKGGKVLVVIDGEEQKQYDYIYNLHYENNSPVYNALDGKRILLVKETFNPESVK